MSALLQRAIEARANDWSLLNDLRAAIVDGSPTSEQSTEWDRIERSILGHNETIDREKRAIEADRLLNQVDEKGLSGAAGEPGSNGRSASDQRAVDYKNAFKRWMQFGMEDLSTDERKLVRSGFQSPESRAQSEGTNTAGGYLVPNDYWVRITEVMKAYGGLANVANTITTSDGRVLPWPKNDDTSNTGRWLGENVQVTATDLAFTTNQLAAYTGSSDLVLVSLELIQDTAFDLDSWVPKKLGQRLGRLFAAGYMNGTGTTQPTGLVPNVPSGQKLTGGTGVGGAFTYSNLVDVQRKIDPAYREAGNCAWIMNDATVGTLLKITDSYGHPLWQPSIQQSQPDFLLGNRLVIDQATPSVAVNNVSVLFGDFESAYVVRNVQGGTMMRLTERYADFLQVGFFGFMRTDGHPDDTNAVSAFVGAAT